MKITTAAVLLLSFIYSTIHGQESFDTVEVTTFRIPLKIKETGRDVTVITAEEIGQISASSIDEILQTVTGLEVQSRGGFGTQGDILLRGSTFTQVLVLVDGMRINDALTGHFNNYIPVAIEEIQRIEVLRGAASSMFGADAVGGVVNIITKVFSDEVTESGLGGSVSYGKADLVDTHMGFVHAEDKWKLGGGMTYLKSDGEFIPEVAIDSSTTLESYNTYFDIKTASLSLACQLTDKLMIKARSSYDYRDFSARYFYTTSPFDKSTEKVGNTWNRVQIQSLGKRSITDINFSFKYNTDEFIFSSSPNNHTTKFSNATFNHLALINETFKIKGGLQLDRRSIVSNDRGRHQDDHVGAYVMTMFNKGNLYGNASLRMDYDKNYDFQFTPGLNLSYLFPTITLRGSVGRSIRAADYTERFVSNNLVDLTPGRSLGNPNLHSEISWSEELGLDFHPSKAATFSLTLFSRQSRGLIDYVSTPSSVIGSVSEIGSLKSDEDYFFARNISSTTTSGFEVNTSLSRQLGELLVKWSIGYTFLDTQSEEDVVSVYLSSHARHLVSTQLTFKASIMDFSLNGLYKQRNARIASGIASELESDYFIWNSRVSAPLWRKLNVHIELRNIFDKEYQNILGARMPGRWLLGGLNWDF